MFNVDLLIEAEAEITDAFEWYEAKQTGLGNKFYKEIDYYLNLIESNPYLFQVKYSNDLRSAALNKFPYLIIFWIDDSNFKVYIVSIFHSSREPKFI